MDDEPRTCLGCGEVLLDTEGPWCNDCLLEDEDEIDDLGDECDDFED